MTNIPAPEPADMNGRNPDSDPAELESEAWDGEDEFDPVNSPPEGWEVMSDAQRRELLGDDNYPVDPAEEARTGSRIWWRPGSPTGTRCRARRGSGPGAAGCDAARERAGVVCRRRAAAGLG